jgi:type III pantothenate kinase
MLLAIDAGNTQTHIGAFDGETLADHWRFATESDATADLLAIRLRAVLDLGNIDPRKIDAAVVASVVPALGPAYEAVGERFGVPVLMVAPGIKTGISVRVDDPREVGADRLVNAVAAFEKYGGPCVVVDFGTAITFDVVSAEGEYLGGVIGPGVEISLEALASRTAKLPRVELTPPERVIGTNTVDSIRSGVVNGFAGAIDGVAARIAGELGGDPRFVATGGLASTVAPLCEAIDEVDDRLTLDGLRLLWEKNR